MKTKGCSPKKGENFCSKAKSTRSCPVPTCTNPSPLHPDILSSVFSSPLSMLLIMRFWFCFHFVSSYHLEIATVLKL